MREVFVIGVGQSIFGKLPQYSPIFLGAQAAKAAIKDSGINPKIIQVAYGSKVLDAAQTIQDVLKRVGITNIEMHNTENACASGGGAINLLWKDIAYGAYDIGIAVGCEGLTTCSKAGQLLGVAEGDLNGTLGITMPSLAALVARRLMKTRGATIEDLARASIKNHANACLNPYAQYKKKITLEDVLKAKMISDPLTSLHCCPISDGGAAAILCTGEIARKYTTKLVKIISSAVLTSAYERWDEDLCDVEIMRQLVKIAYDRAGIGPEDLDLVELHDAFSPEELYSYEALGLCPAGEGINFLRSGATEIGGKLPVNPSGGLQSLGHPLGASGVRVVAEVTQHLRGEAGARQIQGAKVGMAQMVGGYLTGIGAPSVGAINLISI
jgi:benzoylsuccinyl-CoA thiolase BbsB subunit